MALAALLDALKSAINSRYTRHECERPCQGDILRDFSFFAIDIDDDIREFNYAFVVIISQDCDLEQDHNNEIKVRDDDTIKRNQLLPNILILPAYLADSVKTGAHLQQHFEVFQEKKSKDQWSLITKNNNERYHYLHSERSLQVPELVIDFKTYHTLPRAIVRADAKRCYLATINELFRESLATRFANYLSRIATPEM